MKRQTFQNGCVYHDKRRPGLWYFRWRDDSGKQRSKPLGRCPNKAAARKRASAELAAINGDAKRPAESSIRMDRLVDRYIAEKLPERFSTQRAYLSYLSTHILPKWGATPIAEVKPYAVDEWLKSLTRSQKSKAHIKGIMHLLFEHAMLWEYLQNQPNPMRLVRVKGQTKRVREPVNLTPKEFHAIVDGIATEPFRTMTLTALCLGLRFSELTGLKWGDINWMEATIHIQRGVVRGIVDETKNVSSNVELPVAEELLGIWKAWRVRAVFKGDDDWIFASPYFAGKTPYAYSHMLRSIKKAAKKAGIDRISWHSFRHSYRTWLGSIGADVSTMQKLMRHADFGTTMNVYGDVLGDDLRAASTKISEKVLRVPHFGAPD